MPTSSSSQLFNAQPTGYPTTVLPQFSSSYEIISFTSLTTLTGLENSIESFGTVKTNFIASMAKSIAGVRARDISIISMSYSSTSSQLAAVETIRINQLVGVKSTGTGAVSWNISLALDRLGTSSGSVAYASLSNQIDTAMSTGSFITSLTSSSSLLSSILSATTKIDAFVLKTVISPTSMPTAAPTILVIVPTISNIRLLNVTRTTLNLAVTLDSVSKMDIFGGSLYCIGLNKGSQPTSIGRIKAAESDGSFSKGISAAIPLGVDYPLQLDVEFRGLHSLKSYSIFCYAETSVGLGTSLSAVLSTEIVVSTVCCKAIKFLNFPAFVYGDITKYISSSSTLYVFAYELSDTPSEAIEVSPILSINGVRSNDVIATPLSFIFRNTSLLQGKFYLSATSTISGIYRISFAITGPSSAEFSSDMLPVDILSSSSPVPAPVMTSSQFSDSGQKVLVRFDSESDSGGIKAVTWPCSLLLNFIGSTTTLCTWIDAMTISLSFGVVMNSVDDSVLLTVGDDVTLRGGLLRAFCTADSNICSQNPSSTLKSVTIQGPAIPFIPTVILSAPHLVGSCANVTLDATASYGDGGRPFRSILWNVSGANYGLTGSRVPVDTSSIESYLQRFSLQYQVDRPITISRHALSKASYTFTLTLTNFLGFSSTQTEVVVVGSDSNIPILSVLGPSYQVIVASSPLNIKSIATLSTCSSRSKSIEYSWTVQLESGAYVPVKSLSRDPSRFSIPAYSLLVDRTYTVTITAKAGPSSSSVSVSVYVAYGDLAAAVVGGYIRSSPVDKAFVLDASISTDADTPLLTKSTLTYQVRNIHCSLVQII